MAHLLIGWELGHGMGHIMPLRMLAEELLRRNHRLTFIVRDPATAQRALADLPVVWLAAPRVRYRPWELTRTDCYSQLLGNTGFREPEKLESSVGGWIGLLEYLKPDAALLEFSPSAMVACHILGVPFAMQGTGFFCPPADRENFGVMHPRMPVDARRAEDDALLACINGVVSQYGAATLSHISELYALARHTILTTFRELDHFQRGEEARFSGVWVPHQETAPVWPKGDGKKLFAYLNARPGVDRVLKMLSRSGLPTLVVCAGLTREHQRPFESDTCHFPQSLLDMRRLAREADLGIFHGNHSSTATFLLAGTPGLQLPIYMEQLIFARRVKAFGASELATLDRPDRIAEALNRMISSPEYAKAAGRFAERYEDFDQDREIGLAADQLESRLL